MGFLKKLAVIVPATLTKTAFKTHFDLAKASHASDLYDRLLFAWSETTKGYDKSSDGAQIEMRMRIGRTLCKIFALCDNPETAMNEAGICLACMNYPEFAKLPSNKEIISFVSQFPSEVARGNTQRMEQILQQTSPSAAKRIVDEEGSLFNIEEVAIVIQTFLSQFD